MNTWNDRLASQLLKDYGATGMFEVEMPSAEEATDLARLFIERGCIVNLDSSKNRMEVGCLMEEGTN